MVALVAASVHYVLGRCSVTWPDMKDRYSSDILRLTCVRSIKYLQVSFSKGSTAFLQMR